MALLKPRLPEVLEWGIVIGVLEAEGEDAEKWVRFLSDVASLQLDWKYGCYDKKKLPHILYLGDERGRHEAIGRLERYAYRLKGKLLAVACDHAKTQLRPPLKCIQAERDVGTTITGCTHWMYHGPTVHGFWCPGCDTLMVDPGC